MSNQLTDQQILFDYYQLEKILLIKPNKLSDIYDEIMIRRIEHLTQKIAKNFFELKFAE